MAKNFEMSDVEHKEFSEWYQEHKEVCELRKENRYGSITYSFTPIGIGTVIEVKCSCGEHKNLTDTSCW